MIFVCFTTSCIKQIDKNHIETTDKLSTIHEISKIEGVFTEKALTILYTDTVIDWGVVQPNNMTLNFITLSQLCEKELGFPLEFIPLNESRDIYNQYATYIRSGLSADLIFPAKINSDTDGNKRGQYWGDQYIEEGIYMDISPYLAQFCPEAILNFNRYPEIKKMCMREGKTYALYAGMPEINALAIFVRNELVEKNSIYSITDFDMLFEIMQNMHYGNKQLSDFNKIMVNPNHLLEYMVYQSGYYPIGYANDMLLKQDDDKCLLYPIEDTEIFDSFFKVFSRFFENSYFINENGKGYMSINKKDGQDMFITDRPFWTIKNLIRLIEDDNENVFHHYSMFLFDKQKSVIASPDSVQLIMVPYTCTQPEKALYFMQWMMTDEQVSDILSFGSATGKMKHYRYSTDGTIIPEKLNTIYGFCNLIANFTDKAFLYGNKNFDISKTYREMTFNALYPPLYKIVESQHKNFDLLWELEIKGRFQIAKKYINDTLKELITDPLCNITADIMIKELTEFNRSGERVEYCTEFIRNVLQSSEITDGD